MFINISTLHKSSDYFSYRACAEGDRYVVGDPDIKTQ